MNTHYDIVVDELNNKIHEAVRLMYNKHYNLILYGQCDKYDPNRYNEFLNHIFRAKYEYKYPKTSVFPTGARRMMPLKFYRALFFL